MINQVELKLVKRKTPVEHGVSGYTREDGSRVRTYRRGRGSKTARKSKTVGIVKTKSNPVRSFEKMSTIKTYYENAYPDDFWELGGEDLKDLGAELRSRLFATGLIKGFLEKEDINKYDVSTQGVYRQLERRNYHSLLSSLEDRTGQTYNPKHRGSKMINDVIAESSFDIDSLWDGE